MTTPPPTPIRRYFRLLSLAASAERAGNLARATALRNRAAKINPRT